MSIRASLSIGVLFALVGCALLGIKTYQTRGEINRLLEQNEQVSLTVQATFDLNTLTLNYILIPSEIATNAWNTKYSQIGILVNAMEVEAPETIQLVSSIRERHRRMGQNFLEMKQNEREFEAGTLPNSAYEVGRAEIINHISTEIKGIAADATQLNAFNNRNILNAQRNLNTLTLFTIAALFFFLVVGFAYAEIGIMQRIGHLTRTAQHISSGDLYARAPEQPRDELGTLAKTFNTMTSELQHTLNELQENSAKTRALLEAIPDTKFVFDEEARFIEFIPGANFKPLLPPDQFIGKHASEIMSPEIVTLLEKHLQEALRSNQISIFEYPLVRKDHTEYYEARLVSSGSNRVVAVLRDITQSMHVLMHIETLNAELEQRVQQRTLELQDTVQELEAFSYTVSHDLRAPLRAIAGYSQIILMDNEENLSEESILQLKRINQNAIQLGQMVDELLSFSRLGRQAIQPNTISGEQVMEMITDIQLNLEREYPDHSVIVQIDDLPGCHADISLLKLVYTNLMGNAFKFTQKTKEPFIHAGCNRTENESVYFVRDNGAGFDMKYAEKLFGVFNRLHRQDEFEGTGVGLAIVQRIIQRHGGQIWAEAEIGKGACFYFSLSAHTA